MRKLTKLHALATIAVVLLTAVPAMADAPPIGVEDPRLPLGYDWVSRLHATHLVIDATPLASLVDAQDVTTPYIDLEITGLMPWRVYELRLGPIRHTVYSDGFGTGVAWNVIAETAEWLLLDTISHEPVTAISIQAPPPTFEIDVDPHMRKRYSPPPVASDLDEGWVVEQGLYSFTPAVKIEAATNYQRFVTVEAEATAGMAGNSGTAGGSRTYDIGAQAIVAAYGGTQVEYVRMHSFRKDVYADESYKVYSIGERSNAKLVERSYAEWEPGPGAFTWEQPPQQGPQTPLCLSERDAGTVYYGAGAQAFGTPIGVSFKATTGGENTNRICFVVNAGYGGTFKFDWTVGDHDAMPEKGMVGMAWQID